MAAAACSSRRETTIIPSSPVAQVGDNFDVFAPPLVPPEACPVEERGEGSDTESGPAYGRRRRRRRRIEGEGCGGGGQEKRRKTRRKQEGGCAYCEEEEEEDVGNTNLDRASEQERGREGKRQPEKGVVAEKRRDPREEDRAFWELCLAYGYP